MFGKLSDKKEKIVNQNNVELRLKHEGKQQIVPVLSFGGGGFFATGFAVLAFFFLLSFPSVGDIPHNRRHKTNKQCSFMIQVSRRGMTLLAINRRNVEGN
jgi:hypothetical protein